VVWYTLQVALPILLARMEVILKEFLVEQSLSISESGERAMISDVMCVLEVRYGSAMQFVPAKTSVTCSPYLHRSWQQ